MSDKPLTFRPLDEGDMELLHRWLNNPHVSRWWTIDGSNHPTLEQVRNEWQKQLSGVDPVNGYIVFLDERPIGYVQWHMVGDFTESAEMAEDPAGMAGIDLFIGEADCLYQGLGPRMIKSLLSEYIFSSPEIKSCLIDPEPENPAAIRAYEKVRFKYSHTAFNKKGKVYARIMILNREDFTPLS